MSEGRIRIVLEWLRGDDSIAELCQREGVRPMCTLQLVQGLPGSRQKRLSGDTAREATSDEGKGLRGAVTALKEVVADLALENQLLKKSMIKDGEYGA